MCSFGTSFFVGGGSALLPAPVPPITLQEKQEVTRCLAAAGASIQELNTVRRALSLLKGGGLARSADPAQVNLCNSLHLKKETLNRGYIHIPMLN